MNYDVSSEIFFKGELLSDTKIFTLYFKFHISTILPLFRLSFSPVFPFSCFCPPDHSVRPFNTAHVSIYILILVNFLCYIKWIIRVTYEALSLRRIPIPHTFQEHCLVQLLYIFCLHLYSMPTPSKPSPGFFLFYQLITYDQQYGHRTERELCCYYSISE